MVAVAPTYPELWQKLENLNAQVRAQFMVHGLEREGRGGGDRESVPRDRETGTGRDSEESWGRGG
eukprot:752034-Hanusia_phi.AAC.2